MPVIYIRNKPFLTRHQLGRFANILDNAGQVFLGVVVLSPLFVEVDNSNWLVVPSGLVIVSGCWILSMWLTRKEEYGI